MIAKLRVEDIEAICAAFADGIAEGLRAASIEPMVTITRRHYELLREAATRHPAPPPWQLDSLGIQFDPRPYR